MEFWLVVNGDRKYGITASEHKPVQEKFGWREARRTTLNPYRFLGSLCGADVEHALGITMKPDDPPVHIRITGWEIVE